MILSPESVTIIFNLQTMFKEQRCLQVSFNLWVWYRRANGSLWKDAGLATMMASSGQFEGACG